MDQITIALRGGQCDRICRVIDGRDHSIGYLHTAELAAILMASSRVDGDTGDRPWIDLMASNNVAFYQRSSGEVGVIALYGKRLMTLNYSLGGGDDPEVRQFTLMMPPVVWYIRWNSQKVIDDIRLYSIDPLPRTISEGCRLYHMPLGNVEASGKLCWGTAATPYKTPVGAHPVVDGLFFSSNFNKDLAPRIKLESSKALYRSIYGDPFRGSGELAKGSYPLFYWFKDALDARGLPEPLELPPISEWGLNPSHSGTLLDPVTTHWGA